MSAPLYEKLQRHSKDTTYPFAMPGHKGRGIGDFSMGMDVTELPGFDNLHAPEGVIAEAQQKLAALCHADTAHFLVNGSSCGMIAAVLSVCGDGDEILVARNCHVSVYRGLVLAGARPAYVCPETYGPFSGGVTVSAVAETLKVHPKAKALVLTSPTYEGFCSDVAGIAALLHQKGLPLIVDEAHGAHFGYHPLFPAPAMTLGADIAVQSWHKTLPCPTQTAVLLANKGHICEQKLISALKLTQSTSPSYLFMAALDKCRSYLEETKEFTPYAENLLSLRQTLSSLTNIGLIGQEAIGQAGITDVDLGKLVLCPKGIDGHTLVDRLLAHGLYMESSGRYHTLAMTSVFDTKESFVRLAEALQAEDGFCSGQADTPQRPALSLPCQALSPREAYFTEGEDFPLAESIGRIALDFVIPYPPGIPLLSPGEVITQEIIAEILALQRIGIPVYGAEKTVLVQK